MLNLLALLACSGGDEVYDDSAPATDDTADSAGPPVCGSGNRSLPEGLEELSWDDGIPAHTVADFSSFTGYQGTYEIPTEPQYEAVRFELDRPARVHGFSVYWTGLPEGAEPETELSAGLYPDFGYNGFDFWPEALWEGTRCLEDVQDGVAVDYVFEQPVAVEDPGLVYVAHFKPDGESPIWYLDAGTPDGDCGTWDDCHSAWNFPEADDEVYYNGISFALQYDYLVRLHVEYTEPEPESTHFRDATGELSISTRHAWGDYDNDGDDDLFAAGTLFENHEGALADVTDASGLGDATASGGVWGDYDNDGCLDLFVFAESTSSNDSLFQGDCAGGFSDVTDAAGIDDTQDYNLCESDEAQPNTPSPAAAWFDLEGDGDLDLYVVGFICWTDWDFYRDMVWQNNGDGTFTDLTGDQGFSSSAYSGRGVSPADADGDGDVDLMVNNYTLHRNLYYRNDGDGTVNERALFNSQAGYNDSNYFGHTIGAAWGDLDNDGDLDAIHANLAHPRYFDYSDKTRILLNDGEGDFEDILGGRWEDPFSGPGIRYQETHSVPVLADFDQDGVLDLAISNVYDGRPTDFYWGVGDGTFLLDSWRSGIEVDNGWGMAVADIDLDGDLDLAARGALYENDAATGHWVQVRVLGTSSNWGALGANVRLTTDDGETRLRHVQGGTGQGNQDSAYLHFGVGEAAQVSSIEVDFPGGGTVAFEGPWEVDQRLWLREDGETATGWSWPW